MAHAVRPRQRPRGDVARRLGRRPHRSRPLEATYTFAATGRRVHNVIDAEFRFENGLIIEHTDRFDFWRWSRMALGAPGMLLGWTPIVRNKVRGQARAGLDAFLAKA